jgi:CoA-transferase family III
LPSRPPLPSAAPATSRGPSAAPATSSAPSAAPSPSSAPSISSTPSEVDNAARVPDWWERGHTWFMGNFNKRDLTLDLSRPEGRVLLERLLPGCDVLVENYAPRVFEKFGFTPDRVLEAAMAESAVNAAAESVVDYSAYGVLPRSSGCAPTASSAPSRWAPTPASTCEDLTAQ